MKRCPQCKKMFTTKKNSNKKFCSKECVSKHSFKHTPEEIKKMSESMKNKRFTKEHKNKISLSNIKTKNSNEWKNSETYKNMCNKMSNSKIGNIAWNKDLTKYSDERIKYYGKKISEIKNSDEWKNSEIYKNMCKKMSNIQSNKISVHNRSIGEKEVEQYIKTFKNNIIVNKQPFKDFSGRPDFYFPKLNKTIEYNGCYWHAHSCKYPNGYHGTDKRIYQNIKRWNEKIEIYKENNIKLLIVWECEWKNNKEEIKQKIKKFLEE